jgi:predicted kinase
MLELIVFIGFQASGKTTFYRERFAATHTLVSKDSFPNARNKAARQARELAAALSAGQHVVVDNTHPSVEDRAPLFHIAKQYDAIVSAYYFPTPLADCLARNALRQGRARVPDVGLFATAKKLVAPSRDEGFAEIWHVTGPLDARVVQKLVHT